MSDDAASQALTDDHALMRRVQAGDRNAFRQLVHRHGNRAHAYAHRLVGARDARDRVQDAFARAWQQRARFDEERASFSVWFYRILRNLCFDSLRRHRLEKLIFLTDDTASDGDNYPDARATPYDDLAQSQSAALIQRCVAALPERQREVILLCYFDEFSNLDAAAIMGVKPKVVEGLLYRARHTLAVSLKTAGLEL